MTFASICRGYQIIKITLQYGLDSLIPSKHKPWYFKLFRASFFWLYNKHKHTSSGERVKLALQELGPVYIKLGQMLSTRRDLLNDEWTEQLAMLQDRVPPFASDIAIQSIEEAINGPLDSIFDNFNPTPLASASISQVHTANLKTTGEEVVLKVLRPDVEKQIMADLTLMSQLATLMEKILGENNRLRPKEVIDDYRTTILGEINLKLEAFNTIKLRTNFKDSPSLYIPHVYEDLCHSRLLVTERIYGTPVSDIESLKAQGTDLKLLAERGVEIFFTQVFRDNFFHADMHPGNIFICTDNPKEPSYIGLDCGIMGSLTDNDRNYLGEIFLAFFNRDYQRIAQLYINSGWVTENTDCIAFEQAIKTVCEPMFNKPLNEISFGHVLLELFKTARQFEIIVQPQLVLLEKTLLYIEGLGRQLYPQLDLWQTAKPFLETWMKEQIGIKAIFKKAKNNLPYWGEKLPELPELIYDNLKLTKHLFSNHQSLLDKYLKYQHKLHKSNYLLVTAATLLITGAIFSQSSHMLLVSISCTVASIVIWLLGWMLRPKK